MQKRGKTFPVWPVLLLALLAMTALRQPLAQALRAGLDQCAQVVFPSLFPFFILTNLLLATDFPQKLASAWGGAMRRFFHAPPEGAAALAISLLGGYPMGARTAAQLAQQGTLTQCDAGRLLSFCNNTGPAIFFGLIGGTLGLPAGLLAALYAIHILAALATGWLLRPPASPQAGPAGPGKTAPWHGPAPLPVSQAVWQAFCSTARICALILAFRAVLGVLGAVLAFCAPQLAAQPIPAALAAGFLDLPNGIAALAAVPEPAAQFLLCSVFVNWAGLCIHLQTSDAVAPAALPLRYHLRGKLCQCAVAAALSGPVYCCLRGQYTAAALFAAALVLLAGFLQKIKVKVEISREKRYNQKKKAWKRPA